MRKAIQKNAQAIIDLQEVKSSEVLDLVPHVLADMEYEQLLIHEPLNVFSFIQIKGYIETSVNVGIMNLQKLM